MKSYSLLILVLLGACASGGKREPQGLETYTLRREIHEGSRLAFVPHEGKGAFDTYISMELPVEPAKELLRQLGALERKPLRNRGEAHITVVTPIEYFKVLRSRIPPAELHQIAQAEKIQLARFEVLCVGRGEVLINGFPERTYFLVVKSPDLLRIRRRLQELYVKRRGRATDFDPEHFYPHITLGFTDRDLHESDGVLKDHRTCFGNVKYEN